MLFRLLQLCPWAALHVCFCTLWICLHTFFLKHFFTFWHQNQKMLHTYLILFISKPWNQLLLHRALALVIGWRTVRRNQDHGFCIFSFLKEGYCFQPLLVSYIQRQMYSKLTHRHTYIYFSVNVFLHLFIGLCIDTSAIAGIKGFIPAFFLSLYI